MASRGAWGNDVATSGSRGLVRRVDISGLDLESNRTQAWGLKR